MLRRLLLPFLMVPLLGACAPARPAPGITVEDGWARATAPGQSSAALYATITSHGAPDTLTGVSSSVGQAMLHRNDDRGGIARMRMVADLAIGADERVALAPGGTHVMVSGFGAPLKPGAPVTLTLRFAKAGERKVAIAVVAPGAR